MQVFLSNLSRRAFLNHQNPKMWLAFLCNNNNPSWLALIFARIFYKKKKLFLLHVQETMIKSINLQRLFSFPQKNKKSFDQIRAQRLQHLWIVETSTPKLLLSIRCPPVDFEDLKMWAGLQVLEVESSKDTRTPIGRWPRLHPADCTGMHLHQKHHTEFTRRAKAHPSCLRG